MIKVCSLKSGIRESKSFYGAVLSMPQNVSPTFSSTAAVSGMHTVYGLITASSRTYLVSSSLQPSTLLFWILVGKSGCGLQCPCPNSPQTSQFFFRDFITHPSRTCGDTAKLVKHTLVPEFRGERIETRAAAVSAFNFASETPNHYSLNQAWEAKGASFVPEVFGNRPDRRTRALFATSGHFQLPSILRLPWPSVPQPGQDDSIQTCPGPRSPDQWVKGFCTHEHTLDTSSSTDRYLSSLRQAGERLKALGETPEKKHVVQHEGSPGGSTRTSVCALWGQSVF